MRALIGLWKQSSQTTTTKFVFSAEHSLKCVYVKVTFTGSFCLRRRYFRKCLSVISTRLDVIYSHLIRLQFSWSLFVHPSANVMQCNHWLFRLTVTILFLYLLYITFSRIVEVMKRTDKCEHCCWLTTEGFEILIINGSREYFPMPKQTIIVLACCICGCVLLLDV